MPLMETTGNVTADAYGGGVAVAPKYIENFFQTWLRTGTGSSTTVTTGLDASTNKALVWTKSRSAATDHKLTDTVRGATKALISNTTNAQTTDANGLTAFSATGYTIGSDTNYNNSGATYVDWEFVATPKFFDVVTYTGNGSASRAINHNLGSTPGCVIVKQTNTSGNNWAVYHRGANGDLFLNLTVAENAGGFQYITSVSSTTFTVSNVAAVNANGATYVAYLFAHNAGGFGLTGTDNVISCGSFTTDGSGNATVNLGYEPQWLTIKASSTTSNWNTFDSMRGWTVGDVDAILYPNLSNAEYTGYSISQPTATGFAFNESVPLAANTTYIYIAIRRGPMKTPTTGTSVFLPSVQNTNTNATVTTGFPVDMIFQANNGDNRYWLDRLRGTNTTSSFYVTSNTTNAETSTAVGIGVQSNTSFTDAFNPAAAPRYYAWRRAPGFFDEVCYTGTGAVRTLNHNLTVAPEMMIVKDRGPNSGSWRVYHSALGPTKLITLNLANAAATLSTIWNDTAPTSSVFTVGTYGDVNLSGDTFVAYLFASVAGVSKVGSYTGNGTTQTINCGFTGGARFVLIKRTDAAGDWYVYDTARGMTTLTDPYLLLNSTAAESATLGSVTTVSGGFALNASILAAINTNGASYIYLSIA